MAAHFAHATCLRGERCLLFAFEESPAQILRNMRCSYAQGYHLSRPVEGERFAALLGEHRSWAA